MPIFRLELRFLTSSELGAIEIAKRIAKELPPMQTVDDKIFIFQEARKLGDGEKRIESVPTT